ncbi:MAG: LysR family transcriptional regulator [Planctomycetota bacterium]
MSLSVQIKTLDLFCRVADAQSFSDAARAAGLTQSAVSQSMSHLEEVVQTQLIDRSKRPLKLTAAGETYLIGVREVVRHYQEVAAKIRRPDRPIEGPVRVGAIYSVGLSYLPQATDRFQKAFPNVSLKTEFGSSERVVDLVKAGQVDFGLVSFPRDTRSLASIPWQSEPMRLVCAAEHPLAARTEVSAQELDGLQMMGFQRGLHLRHAIDQCLKKAGVAVDFDKEFDNADSMIRAIQLHESIGFVPEAAVRLETAAGSIRVVACRGIQMVRPLGIIHRRRSPLSPAAIEFGSLLLGREMPSPLDRKSNEAPKTELGTPGDKLPHVSVVA